MSPLLPQSDDGLELFAAHVAELILELRDEGHLLSPMDQHLIETWWEAGYPLDTVLGTVRTQGPRLKKRKRPPRGLPLSSMKKAVQTAGDRALSHGIGRAPDEPEPTPEALQPLRADLLAALETAPHRGPLRIALAEVEDLLAGTPSEEALYASLLGVGRRYYAARLAELAPSESSALRSRVRSALPTAVQGLPPDVLESTLAEHCLRALRSDDPVLDPARYWTAT